MTVYTWRSGHLYGGGGINCITADPTGGGRWVAGGDNNGPKWSNDNGVSWEQGFGGLEDDNIGDELQTCGLEWSQDATYPDRVWRASGAGLSVSNNAGKDWQVAKNAAAVNFSHGSSRPRVVGHLIADDGAGNLYLCANETTPKVFRYSGFDADGLNGTLTNIATMTAVPTGCSLDPNSSTTLYVSTRDGVYRLTGITGGSATKGTYSGTGVPTRAEEIVAIDEGGTTRLYVAAYGTVKKVTAGTLSNTWTDITPGSGSQWCSIDGYYSGGNTYLVAGTGSSPIYANGYAQVWRSTNGGTSWTCLTGDNTDSDFVNKMGGPGGDPWWGYGLRAGATPKEKSPNRWIEKGATVEQILYHPTNRNFILGAGQQGCWAFDLTTAKCYPYLVGAHMGVETNIQINDTDDDEIYVVNSDHIGHHTKVGGLNGDWRKNENSSPVTTAFNSTTAFKALAYDSTTTPARWFAGFSHRTANTLGDVYYHNDPSDGTGWETLGFKSFGGGKQPSGLGVRRIGSSVIVIAAVRMGGIAKATFSTADPPVISGSWVWKNQTAFSTFDSERRAVPIIWASDTIVYAYDPTGTTAGGLWRSTNAGDTWMKIWGCGNRSAEREGFIAVAPDDPDIVYVSLGPSADAAVRGVWRLDGATTGTVEAGTISRTEIRKPNGSSVQAASCVVCNSGGKMAFIDMTTTESYIFYSADHGTTTQNITDEYFRRSAKKVFSSAMDSQGRIYVTMNGPGIIVGEPDTVTPPPPPPTEPGDITYTNKIAEVSATNGATYETASFNAGAADRLLVAFVWNASTDATAPTVTASGHSLTWTARETSVIDHTDTTQRRVTMFTALTTTTSSGTFIATAGGSETQTAWAVWIGEYAAVDPAAYFVQSEEANWNAVSSKPSITLASPLAAHGHNAVVYASVVTRNPAAWTEEVGWTELWDSGESPTTGVHVAHVLAGTDNSFAASAGTNGRWGAVIMEIAATPGSSATGYLVDHGTDGVVGAGIDVTHDDDGIVSNLGVRLLTSDVSDSDATSYTTASITPATGEGVVVGVANSRSDGVAAETPTLSGAGLTWTNHRTIEYSDTDAQRRRLTAFLGVGTPSTGTVSISFGTATQTGCSWAFMGIPGAASPGEVVDNRATGTEVGVTITPSSASSLVAFFAAKKGTESLFTEDFQDIVEEVNTAPNHHLLAGYSLDNGPQTIRAVSSDIQDMGIIGIEVAAVTVGELEHDTDGVTSGTTTTPGTGGNKPPKPPKPPKVHWTIDGQPVSVLPGWSATAGAMRGFDQMRGSIPEEEWRRLGSTVAQGSDVVGTADTGEVVWEGRLSSAAEVSGGEASFAAQGWFIRAERKGDRLFIQSKDMDTWTPVDGEPFVNDNGGSYFSTYRKISVGVGNRIRFEVDKDEAVVASNADGAAFWAEGVPLKRIRFTMNYNSTDDTSDFEVRLQRATGPDGTVQNVNTWPTSTANRDSQKSVTLGQAEDCLILQLLVASGHTTTAKRAYRLTNIVVNSTIDTGDTFYTHQVADHIGNALGWDTDAVVDSTVNVLPFDWRDGSWAEALSYVAELEDRVWGVYESTRKGPRLTYDEWGATEWTVYQSHGATLDLTPMEVHNRARVWYENTHGRTRSEVAVADPDPLAASGIVNTIEYDLRDRQAGSALAATVAAKIVERYSRQRYSGRVTVFHAYDATGVDDIYAIRPGDTVRIADWGADEAITLRIYDVTYRDDSVQLGIEMPISLTPMLKHVFGKPRREHR